MELKKIVDVVKHEIDVLKGEESKDKDYSSEHTYPDEAAATEAFTQAKAKLFYVNGWSNLPGITSTFTVFDAAGQLKPDGIPEIGDYIHIELPGPTPENWVTVIDIQVGENSAEFTVSPSEDPRNGDQEGEQVKHFFSKEATSTFRVTRQGRQVLAWEIGRNEYINNQGAEAGDRPIVNTLIAEGGWAFFQGMQWKKLTEYLVQTQ